MASVKRKLVDYRDVQVISLLSDSDDDNFPVPTKRQRPETPSENGQLPTKERTLSRNRDTSVEQFTPVQDPQKKVDDTDDGLLVAKTKSPFQNHPIWAANSPDRQRTTAAQNALSLALGDGDRETKTPAPSTRDGSVALTSSESEAGPNAESEEETTLILSKFQRPLREQTNSDEAHSANHSLGKARKVNQNGFRNNQKTKTAHSPSPKWNQSTTVRPIKFDPYVGGHAKEPRDNATVGGVKQRRLSEKVTEPQSPRFSVVVSPNNKGKEPERSQSLSYRPASSTPSLQPTIIIDNSQRSQHSIPAKAYFETSRQDVQVPEKDRMREREVIKALRKSADVARTRATSVARVVGPAGYFYLDDDTIGKLATKLQNSTVRTRKSKKPKLDFGPPRATYELDRNDLLPPRAYLQHISQKTVSIAPGAPLTLTNTINDRQLNGKFQFVASYVLNTPLPNKPARPPTHCTRICTTSPSSCNPDTCDCTLITQVDEVIDVYGDEARNRKHWLSTKHRVPAYHRIPNPHNDDNHNQPPTLTVLRDAFIADTRYGSRIVECTSLCPCPASCTNRLVQHGRTLSLDIFMTLTCGFGIRSPQPIAAGQFIDSYLGELLLHERTLEAREDALADGASSYVYGLDWMRQDASVVHIDGMNFGSVARFINHSCNANCRVFPVMLEGDDERIYGLGIFAVRDIGVGVELTINYDPKMGDGDDDDAEGERRYGDDVAPFGAARCQCGEENCRIWLWPGPKKRKWRAGKK